MGRASRTLHLSFLGIGYVPHYRKPVCSLRAEPFRIHVALSVMVPLYHRFTARMRNSHEVVFRNDLNRTFVSKTTFGLEVSFKFPPGYVLSA